MKAHAHVLVVGARERWQRGTSYRRVALLCGVSVSTVKSWKKREGWKRDATGQALDGEGGMQPGGSEGMPNAECRMSNDGGGEVSYRGITVREMPHRRATERRWAFAQFKRGLWPPRFWKVSKELVGRDLAVLLEERYAGFYRKSQGAGNCQLRTEN